MISYKAVQYNKYMMACNLIRELLCIHNYIQNKKNKKVKALEIRA